MTPALWQRLRDAFPRLYQSRPEFQRQGATLPYIFECEDGWFELLWDLSARLETMIAAVPADEQRAYGPAAVKEKWGLLRMDLSASTPEMDAAISQAEEQSSQTCEMCGEPGTLIADRGFWWMTRCARHS